MVLNVFIAFAWIAVVANGQLTSPPDVCWNDAYARGVGTIPKHCDDGSELNGALCYPICDKDYVGVGPVCWQKCPQGWTDTGAFCYHDGKTTAKKSHGRTAGKIPHCDDAEEEQAGLCYKKCNNQTVGTGPVCWFHSSNNSYYTNPCLSNLFTIAFGTSQVDCENLEILLIDAGVDAGECFYEFLLTVTGSGLKPLSDCRDKIEDLLQKLEIIEKCSAPTSQDDIISKDAKFPNGSYIVPLASLIPGPSSLAPSQPNTSQLQEIGVQVDDSYTVAAAGRSSYMYISVPSQGARISALSNAVTAIGVKFGDAKTLNIVPLSNAGLPLSGLRQVGILPDMSAVYELQVTMPTSMCPTGTSCNALNWRSFSIFADLKSGSGSDLSSRIHVACGPQCQDSSDSVCSDKLCKTCSSNQVAGGDQAKSVSFYMGTSPANVSFEYETFTIKDDITVWYDGQIIFDTGCVGEHSTKELQLSGKASEIRVDVHPNCLGTTGTQWYFIVGCPDACQSDDKNANPVKLMRDKTHQVKDGDKVEITAEPKMPQLTANYCQKQAKTVDWTLKLYSSERPPKHSRHGTQPPCDNATFTSSHNPWEIDIKTLRGGHAVLSWQTDRGDKGSMKFDIIGKNPSKQAILNELKNSAYPQYWYIPLIIQLESQDEQFLVKTGDPYNGTPKPNGGDDGGFGLMQITDPKATCTQAWNWKENIAMGMDIIKKNQAEANAYMSRQIQLAASEGYHNLPPPRDEFKCHFQEGTSETFGDANAIKAYNGLSTDSTTCRPPTQQQQYQICGQPPPHCDCPHARDQKCIDWCKHWQKCHKDEMKVCVWYCVWDAVAHQWKFNLHGSTGRNYVNDVCRNKK